MKEYRLPRFERILILSLIPLLLFGFYAFIIYTIFYENKTAGENLGTWIPVLLVFTSIQFYGLLDAIKSKVTIDINLITATSVFQRKTLMAEEIASYKLEPYHIIIYPKSKNKKKIRINRRFKHSGEIIEWLESFCDDLDYLTAQQNLQEILDAEHQGFTDKNFDKKIASAKKAASLLNWTAGLLSLWTVFFPKPYDFLIISLIILFVLCLISLRKKNEFLQFCNPDHSLYPSILPAFVSICFALGLRSLEDFLLLNYIKTWAFAILSGIVFTIVSVAGRKEFYTKNKLQTGSVVFCFIVMLIYGYAITVLLNCRYDYSTPQIFTAEILDKRIVTGKTKSYYLQLPSWGPIKESKEIEVSKTLFNKVNKGETVSLHYRKGNFSIPWFEVVP